MGYVDYVESAILESGLEETGELLELMEEATSVEDLEAIEEYLTEKQSSADPDPRGPKLPIKTKLNQMRYDRQEKKSQRRDDRAYARAWKAATDKTGNMTGDLDMDKAYKKIDQADNLIKAGSIAAAAAAIISAATFAGLKIRAAIKKSNSSAAKQLEKQMKALEDQAKDVAKRCNKGEITAKEAKVETKKIQAQMKKLEKEAAKIAKAESAVKESVDMDITDIQLAIFESCDEGEISEEDRDELLEMLEG